MTNICEGCKKEISDQEDFFVHTMKNPGTLETDPNVSYLLHWHLSCYVIVDAKKRGMI